MHLVKPACYKMGDDHFGVPSFFPFQHRETSWMINMIKSTNWPRMRRRLQTTPELFRATYFQIPDKPAIGDPLFHHKVMLYLNVVALCVYIGNSDILRLIIDYKEVGFEDCMVDVNEPCFVTNLKEKSSKITDVHAIYPFCIAIRRNHFHTLPHLMEGGWIPHESLKLPYRKMCCAFNFCFIDAIDYFLGQMCSRPSLDLSRFFEVLIRSYHENFNLRNCLMENKRIDYSTEMEDYITIPRRLLRFMAETDVNFRFTANILSAINVFIEARFFDGPTRFSRDIDTDDRMDNYKAGLSKDTYETRATYDQDCCIALLLGFIYKCEIRNVAELHRKTVFCVIRILGQTRWLLRFFDEDITYISDYFESVGESVKIGNNIVKLVRATIPRAYQVGMIKEDSLDTTILDFRRDIVEQLIELKNKSENIEDEEVVGAACARAEQIRSSRLSRQSEQGRKSKMSRTASSRPSNTNATSTSNTRYTVRSSGAPSMVSVDENTSRNSRRRLRPPAFKTDGSIRDDSGSSERGSVMRYPSKRSDRLPDVPRGPVLRERSDRYDRGSSQLDGTLRSPQLRERDSGMRVSSFSRSHHRSDSGTRISSLRRSHDRTDSGTRIGQLRGPPDRESMVRPSSLRNRVDRESGQHGSPPLPSRRPERDSLPRGSSQTRLRHDRDSGPKGGSPPIPERPEITLMSKDSPSLPERPERDIVTGGNSSATLVERSGTRSDARDIPRTLELSERSNGQSGLTLQTGSDYQRGSPRSSVHNVPLFLPPSPFSPPSGFQIIRGSPRSSVRTDQGFAGNTDANDGNSLPPNSSRHSPSNRGAEGSHIPQSMGSSPPNKARSPHECATTLSDRSENAESERDHFVSSERVGGGRSHRSTYPDPPMKDPDNSKSPYDSPTDTDEGDRFSIQDDSSSQMGDPANELSTDSDAPTELSFVVKKKNY